jgi:hypothetical protein
MCRKLVVEMTRVTQFPHHNVIVFSKFGVRLTSQMEKFTDEDFYQYLSI